MIYDMTIETVKELMCGEYYSHFDDKDNLMGYYCFGKSAQIPTTESDIYRQDMLDIGLGLNSYFCGKGLGRDFLELGLEFAKHKFNVKDFRLTVAQFNQRAIKVYKNIGFANVTTTHLRSHNKFVLMTLQG